MDFKMNRYLNKWIFISLLLAITSGCNKTIIKGNGTIETKKIDLSNFKEVSIVGQFDVNIIKDDKYALTIQTDQNLIPYIKHNIQNDRLAVRMQEKKWLEPTKTIIVTITSTYLNKLSASGDVNIKANNLNAETLAIDTAGSANLDADNIYANNLKLTSSGNVAITLSGTAKNAEYELSGNIDFNSKNLKTEKLTLITSGNSQAQVFASNYLKINSAGSNTITYYGNPAELLQENVGSNNIKAG